MSEVYHSAIGKSVGHIVHVRSVICALLDVGLEAVIVHHHRSISFEVTHRIDPVSKLPVAEERLL